MAQPNLHVGVAFLLLRTCIRYLRERILYSVGTNTRRQAKLIVVLLTWLANAVGVLNECKSSRADSECRFSFFGEAKKSKCPVGTRRMVKATLKANHKAATHFQAALSCKQRQPENQNCQTNHAPKKSHTHKKSSPKTHQTHFQAAHLFTSIKSYFVNFSNAATAGNSLPSKNSINAPPPVEI